MQYALNINIENKTRAITNGDVMLRVLNVKDLQVVETYVVAELRPSGQARFDLEWWNAPACNIP